MHCDTVKRRKQELNELKQTIPPYQTVDVQYVLELRYESCWFLTGGRETYQLLFCT